MLCASCCACCAPHPRVRARKYLGAYLVHLLYM